MRWNFNSLVRSPSIIRAVVYGTLAGVVLFFVAISLGLTERGLWATLSLIGIGVTLEAQPGAVASIPLGFSPLVGAVVSILANLICIPLLVLMFHQVVIRWKWIGRKMAKAQKWTTKYGKYGVWMFVPLCPILGAYVCLALGMGMQWRLSRTMLSVFTGLIASTFILTYFGHLIAALIHG